MSEVDSEEDVQCDHLPSVVNIIVIILMSIAVVSNILLLTYALYKFTIKPPGSGKLIESKVKAICICCILSLSISSLCHTVECIEEFKAECPSQRYDSIFYQIAVYLDIIFGSIGFISIETLLAVRVIDALKGSIFEISKKNKTYICTFISIQILLTLIGLTILSIKSVIGAWNENDSILFWRLAALWYVNYTANCIMIVVIFIKKLKILSKVLFKGKDKAKEAMFNIAVKITYCCSVAMFTSIVYVIVSVLNSLFDSNIVSIFGYILGNIDSTVNIICVLLQWEFTQNIYNLLCYNCDKRIKHCCAKEFHGNNNIESNESSIQVQIPCQNNN